MNNVHKLTLSISKKTHGCLFWGGRRFGGGRRLVDVELSKEESTETRISVQPSNSCADLQNFRSVLLTFKKIWGFLVNR